MKKAGIIGIAIAIIVAGGLGIFAVSNITMEPLGPETTIEFGEEATGTVEQNLGDNTESFDFGEEAAGTVEEDSSDEKGRELNFGESVSVVVENP